MFKYTATASVVYSSEFLATDQKPRVRFPALSDFLCSSGSETGPMKLVRINEIIERKNSDCGLESRE
jgi:hypothetical protein